MGYLGTRLESKFFINPNYGAVSNYCPKLLNVQAVASTLPVKQTFTLLIQTFKNYD